MTSTRSARRTCPLLIIGFDGAEISYLNRLMDAGEMPWLSALRDRSARFLLDHGSAQSVGLAWEHFASGLSPEDADRWSAIEFDPATYRVWQEGARCVPFFESLDVKVTVFDPPYFNLGRSPKTRGIVGWGSHDAGVTFCARPHSLGQAFHERFGAYPSTGWIYTTPAYSAENCRRMGKALAEGLRARLDAARWLIAETPDSDVFMICFGEFHAAIEGLWHGVDPHHPMHAHPSASVAAKALKEICQAADAVIGGLMNAVDDAEVLAFSIGGMGANASDVQTMALLPELLYRHSTGSSLLETPQAWRTDPDAVLDIPEEDGWGGGRRNWYRWYPSLAPRTRSSSLLRRIGRKLVRPLKGSAPKSPHHHAPQDAAQVLEPLQPEVEWLPVVRYRSFWPRMKAFALPSYFDGRIRLNLAGRESRGQVALEDYEATRDEIEDVLRACRDPRTDAPAVAAIRRKEIKDPLKLNSSDADLEVVWGTIATAIEHPSLGVIGPVPFRRTGGHTGPYGFAFLAAQQIASGDHGVRSSFDLTPTVCDLVGQTVRGPLSGRSLLTPRA
ncbi:hypothetical protein [Thiocapsa bogorovii]|uniref:hypothetical protein n=1 Tax=Thiocapsa bogorovii TaxID=521689 RepID=UPI001E4E1F45|nr:hypothetical protein [Thiocapsa bogorovii]UHD15867.1 hypothetical protein LT988_21855 [Thiocapsa bogorovii]